MAIAELDGGRLAVGDPCSIFAEIEHGLQISPDAVALECPEPSSSPPEVRSGLLGLPALGSPGAATPNEPPPPGGLAVTYRQLHAAAHRLAASLQKQGVGAGATVLVLAPNGAAVGLLLWTSALARLTFAAVDTGLLESPAEHLGAILAALAPSVIVVPDGAGQQAVDAALAAAPQPPPALRLALEHDGASDTAWLPFWRLVQADRSTTRELAAADADRARETAARAGDDPHRTHSVLFTSGTSAGRPKGCPMSVRNTVHLLRSQAWLLGEGAASRRVLVQAHNARAIAPALMLQTWRVGGAVLLPCVTPRSSFALADLVAAVAHQRATFVVVSPALVHALSARAGRWRADALDAVRGVQLGGDAVTRAHLAQCAALFPRATVCINHGMSEGGGFFAWPFGAAVAAAIPCLGELCPVGAVAPGTTVRIWAPARNRVARRGEPGALHVCGGTIIAQYLGGADAAAFYTDVDGRRWLVTGDQAVMDDAGLVFIMGRSADALRRGGDAIMPVVIESCVDKYAQTQSCVVPLPRDSAIDADDELVVVLRAFNDRTEGEIRAHIVSALGSSHTVDGVVSLHQLRLREFPVNATHKIVKRELAEMVALHRRDALFVAEDSKEAGSVLERHTSRSETVV